MMAKIAALILEIDKPEQARRIMVVDGLSVTDRPAAVGFFVLTTMRQWYARFKSIGPLRMYVANLDAKEAETEVDAYTPLLKDDWFGEIYRLVVQVERGDTDFLKPGE